MAVLSTSALLGLGAMNLAGGLFGAGANYAASGEAVKRQLAWERERATHAHQWEVQDLINAGLNPVLSAGGSGAVTGGISAPQPDMSTGIQQAMGTGLQLAELQAELAKKGAETQNIGEDTKLKKEQKLEAITRAELNKANSGLTTAKTAGQKIENEIAKYRNEMKEVEFLVNIAKSGAGIARDMAVTILSGKMGLSKPNTGKGMKSLDLSNVEPLQLKPLY